VLDRSDALVRTEQGATARMPAIGTADASSG